MSTDKKNSSKDKYCLFASCYSCFSCFVRASEYINTAADITEAVQNVADESYSPEEPVIVQEILLPEPVAGVLEIKDAIGNVREATEVIEECMDEAPVEEEPVTQEVMVNS
jgi:hypothetical protein